MAKAKQESIDDILYCLSGIYQKAYAYTLRYKSILVCLSGGWDSDVMLDILLTKSDNVKNMTFAFFDTGIEYDATKRHLADLEKKYSIKIHHIKASMPVPLGCKKYGIPFLSKYVSEMIYRLQRNNFDFSKDGGSEYNELIKKYKHAKIALKWWCNQNGEKSAFNIDRNYLLKDFLINNPPDFRISQKCCEGAKKLPAKNYEKNNIFDCKCTGVRKDEHGARSTAYKNCFTYNPTAKTQNFRPIWWLTDAAKDFYTKKRRLTRSDCYIIYGMARTGCAGCPFGSNFENELTILKRYEPKLYNAVINIFGKSYEYTRKYREYKENKKRELNNGK